jgi:hypothetical protein
MSEKPPKQALNEQIQALTKEIEEFYGEQLHPGMPAWLAVEIEQQRQEAHADLRRRAMMTARTLQHNGALCADIGSFLVASSLWMPGAREKNQCCARGPPSGPTRFNKALNRGSA